MSSNKRSSLAGDWYRLERDPTAVVMFACPTVVVVRTDWLTCARVPPNVEVLMSS